MRNNKHQRKAKANAAIRKAKRNRDKARQKLLVQRELLAERRASNRKQCEQRREDTSSDDNGNPTVSSLVPRQRTNRENAARNAHSSVPERPKYSSVEPRPRLYGCRFYTARVDEDESDE